MAGDSRDFLSEYHRHWKNFTIYTFCLRKMFDYLDRYVLKNQTGGNQTLAQTALDIFRQKVF